MNKYLASAPTAVSTAANLKKPQEDDDEQNDSRMREDMSMYMTDIGYDVPIAHTTGIVRLWCCLKNFRDDFGSRRDSLLVENDLPKMKPKAMNEEVNVFVERSILVACFGMACMVGWREVAYNYPDSREPYVTLLRFMESFSTLYLIYCLYQIYDLTWCLKRSSFAYLHNQYVWSRALINQFIVEVLVCVIHDPPFVSVAYDISLERYSQGGVSVYVENPW